MRRSKAFIIVGIILIIVTLLNDANIYDNCVQLNELNILMKQQHCSFTGISNGFLYMLGQNFFGIIGLLLSIIYFIPKKHKK